MPAFAIAGKRVAATQTSMMSVHKASTAPGARMLSDIFPPFGCGALTIRPREGDARAERSQCKKAISALQRRDEILRPADEVAQIGRASCRERVGQYG